MTDADAFKYYDEPAHREPVAGRPQRRPDRTLTEQVPVRFPAATIEAVRELADPDGMTVGAWIRRVIASATRDRTGTPAEEPPSPASRYT